MVNQRRFVREPWQSWQLCREAAEKQLEEYRRHARLVITSALHCAQPCLAMGIPVVFIKPEYNERERYSSMDGILRQYTIRDLEDGKIDFNPDALDIEDLKDVLIINLCLSIKEHRTQEEEKKLNRVREIIENYNIVD